MQSNKIINKLWFRIILSIFCISVLGVGFLILKNTKKGEVLGQNNPEKCDKINTDDYLGLATIELAQTESEKEKGLMNRKNICDNYGMLFVYDRDLNQDFWMKDTPESLDIIFIKSSGEIDTIHKSTKPYNLFPTYASSNPCKYVLEVKAGFSDIHQLKLGDKIEVDKLLSKGVDYGKVSN